MSDQERDRTFEGELRSLVSAGQRVEAVQRYRERTGASMKEAGDAVTALAREQGITQRESDSVEWDVISLLERGQKLQAVKFYRERMGSGLKEATDAVEQIAAEHGVHSPGGIGCLSVIGLGLIALLCTVIVVN